MKSFEDKMALVVAFLITAAMQAVMLEKIDWAWLPRFDQLPTELDLQTNLGVGAIILYAASLSGFLNQTYNGWLPSQKDHQPVHLWLSFVFMIVGVACSLATVAGGQMWPTGTFWTVVVVDGFGLLLTLGYILTNDKKGESTTQNA